MPPKRGRGGPVNRRPQPPRARGRGRGRGRGFPLDDQVLDPVVQLWPNQNFHESNVYGQRRTSGIGAPQQLRGNGRGGSYTSRGRGNSAKFDAAVPLSRLLHAERPYLKPILFVRSTQEPFLFQDQDELLKPLVEEVGESEENHVPKADKVALVFSSSFVRQDASGTATEQEGEILEEVDFNDMAAFVSTTETISFVPASANEEQFTGAFLNRPAAQHVASVQPESPTTTVESSKHAERDLGPVIAEPTGSGNLPALSAATLDTSDNLFVIDTQPAAPSEGLIIPEYSSIGIPLGVEPIPDEDEEVIVYVAPHPRNGSLTSKPLPAPFQFSFSSSTSGSGSASPVKSQVPRQQPGPATPHSQTKTRLKAKRKEAFIERARQRERPINFGLGDKNKQSDPKYTQRRQGDSDLDWGDSEPEDAVVAHGKSKMAVSPGASDGGMDVEPGLDIQVLKNFVKNMGMSSGGGSWLTADDLNDIEALRKEDEDNEATSEVTSDDEYDDAGVQAMLLQEEEMMVAEGLDLRDLQDSETDDEKDDDLDDDEDYSEDDLSFTARLKVLRATSAPPRNTSEEEEGMIDRSWAEKDDDYIAFIEDMLAASADLKGKNTFASVKNGAFGDQMDWKPARRKRDKYIDPSIPPELQAQWQKDRSRKAAKKAIREQERLLHAADPLLPKKGRKKGRKAMLAVARLEPTINVIPNRVMDLTSLVQQIRRFLADLGGPQEMKLPPTDKGTRKNIHELAIAFGLKSVSKGKGDARYTTLSKTSRSGIMVNERKIGLIVRRGAGGEFVAYNTDKRKGKFVPGHKEGEEVGAAAPKIGAANVGFQILAAMGWSEGDRIGLTGGLADPLVAVMKTTKLGLGATR